MNAPLKISNDFLVQRVVEIAENDINQGDHQALEIGIRKMFNKASLASVARHLGVDHETTPLEYYLSEALEKTNDGKQFMLALNALYLLVKDDAELAEYFTSFDRPEDIFIELGDAKYVDAQFDNLIAWSEKIFGSTAIGKQAFVNALNFD